MSDEIINQDINMLPDFILESQQFKSWKKHNPGQEIYHIPCNLLLSDLNITSQKNIDDIIECESILVFSQKHRITILKNIYKFWREDPQSSLMHLPKENLSWFGNQVRALFSKPNTSFTIVMSCMKHNYLDLYEYILERDGSNSFTSNSLFAVYPLLYYAIINEHIDILCRGIETGCIVKFELLEASIIKNNMQIFNILVDEIKKQGISLKSSTFCYAAKNASPNMFKKMLDEFVTTDIDEFCFIRCRGELIIHALHNIANLKILLTNYNLGAKQRTVGSDLLKECLKISAPIACVMAIEDHFNFTLEDYRESRSEIKLEQHINEEIVKRDNLELFTYMLSCGYLVDSFLEDVAVINATTKITPGLVRSHLSLSM